MPNSTITLVYSLLRSGNVSATDLEARMAAVPLDIGALLFWGLRLESDSTTVVSNTVSRTIVVGMDASTPATVTATPVVGDGNGGPLQTVAVGTHGIDYVANPILTVVDPDGVGAVLRPELGAVGVTVDPSGAGYTAATTVTAIGGQLDPRGVHATFTPTIAFGHITGITANTSGGPYGSPPTLVIADPGGGSGAVAVCRLGLVNVAILEPGSNYSRGVAVTVTPLFKKMAPDSAGNPAQASTIQSFMLAALSAATRSPVSVVATVT